MEHQWKPAQDLRQLDQQNGPAAATCKGIEEEEKEILKEEREDKRRHGMHMYHENVHFVSLHQFHDPQKAFVYSLTRQSHC